MNNHLFMFGFGYVAASLAKDLRGNPAWKLSGTTRDGFKCLEGQRAGMNIVKFDDADAVKDALKSATHILISIPPSKEYGEYAMRDYREALVAAAPYLEWVGYLSTTGVYGDADGAWVDENTAPKPTFKRDNVRLEAENTWLHFGKKHEVAAQVFRLGGIYGPGRSALERLQHGEATRIQKAGHVFNRIHVSDIVGALKLSMAQPTAGEIFNVVDDAPTSGAEVVEFAAKLLGVDAPPAQAYDEAKAAMSPTLQEFYRDCKRVKNEKLKACLGWAPQYPTHKEGLTAIAEHLPRAA